MCDAHEFFALLEKVAQDGELSRSEIIEIGTWINLHRDSRNVWPVDVFYKLLKTAFADGNLDATEAKDVARLLESVLKERTTKLSSTHIEKPREITIKFDQSVAKLPSIPWTCPVVSQTDSGVSYEVNLLTPECECPDFQGYRKRLPELDLSRCCKHILQAYAMIRPKSGWTSWLDAFVSLGIRPDPQQQWKVVNIAKQNILVSSPSRGWSNVFVGDGEDNCKYGYNIDQDRWSYGREPARASQLAKQIRSGW